MNGEANEALFNKNKLKFKYLKAAFLLFSLFSVGIGLFLYGTGLRPSHTTENKLIYNISLYLNPLNCGISKTEPSNLNERIINGDASRPHSWPWMVSIGYFQNRSYINFCGGSIISKRFILTAASCFDDQFMNILTGSVDWISSLRIFIGINDLYEDVDDSDAYFIAKIILHPDFGKKKVTNDIALIKLNKNIIKSYNVEYACINTDHNLNYDDAVYTLGWGLFNMTSLIFARNLQQVKLSVLPSNRCAEFEFDQLKQVCIGIKDTNNGQRVKDTCYGDTGGPVMDKFDNITNWFQVGITSHGDIKCSGSSVYTLVSYYYRWILDNIATID